MSCRLSDATVNHGVGLLETSLVTSTAVASVSSIEYAADSAMTRTVLMGKRENAGLANNNERGAVDISKRELDLHLLNLRLLMRCTLLHYVYGI